jgi:hypothetical protein
MRIYLLTTYEEHGATEITGTTDPTKLPEILVNYTADDNWNREALADLERALGQMKTGDWKLGRGWGGVNLHILDIE